MGRVGHRHSEDRDVAALCHQERQRLDVDPHADSFDKIRAVLLPLK